MTMIQFCLLLLEILSVLNVLAWFVLTTAECLLGFDSWGRCRAYGGGQAWVLPVFILHESTVKAIFDTPCELLGGYQERKPGVLYKNWGCVNPLWV